MLCFVNEWLAALADSAVGLLAAHLAALPLLPARACVQLLTDIDYLGYGMLPTCHDIFIDVAFLLACYRHALRYTWHGMIYLACY